MLLAALAPAQGEPWLREAERIAVPQVHMVAADLSLDGTLVVAATEQRELVVYDVESWVERRHWRIERKGTILDLWLDADRSQVVARLLPADTEKPTEIAWRLADGAVDDHPRPLPLRAETAPPTELATLFPEVRIVRANADRHVAVFRVGGDFGVWRGGRWRWLGASAASDFALTADGAFVLLARSASVETVAVDGGRRWSLPLGFGGDVVMAPTANGSGFAAMSADEIVVADARQERATLRLPLRSFGVVQDEPARIAISPRGDRVVVSGWRDEDASRQLDLRTHAAQLLPRARLGVFWPEDDSGVLLFDGFQCCSVRDAKWTWMPSAGAPATWAPVAMAMVNGALVPGRTEIVLATWDDLRRCDVRDGRVLAAIPAQYVWHVGVVADYLIDVKAGVHEDPEQLELRRLDDLGVAAHMPCPRDSSGLSIDLRTAARAPRIAWCDNGVIVVADVRPPAREGR